VIQLRNYQIQLGVLFKELSILNLIIWEESKFLMALHFTKSKDEIPYLCISVLSLTSKKEKVW
jgi:hypothetical protein